ncbi:MAG: 16S rRNA (guanine(527)-N(7))-methyltransferase RsmG [Deltaproteobacteria bacterium]|nr:16S rRNA (guanine(527)-N(7))-methyltransferase RsmG [Deltaproteobacteria bacterium]
MLTKGATGLGVELPAQAIERFLLYMKELKAWNRRINLTAIDDDSAIITRHFLDSLLPAPYLKDATTLLDIGAGAGFPGIPLKIAMPGLNVTLVDSVTKKVMFMRHVCRTLGLGKDIEAVSARVEDKAVLAKYGASFDAVISRAFSGLGAFLEAAMPYVRPGGLIIAMKGPRAGEELAEAAGVKGVGQPEPHEAAVPFTGRRTTLVIFRKEA